MTLTRTATATYTVVDIEKVVRRLKADLCMIADSTGAWTAAKEADYAHDIEILAKDGYLSWVDVTLFSYGVEVKAARFEMDTNAGSLVTSRPGGVLWPRVQGASLRIVLGYTPAFTSSALEAIRCNLRTNWVTSYDDTSHTNLVPSGGRNYVSNAYGIQRKDWT